MVGCGRTAGVGVGEMGWRLFGSVDKRWKEEREKEREREREGEDTIPMYRKETSDVEISTAK